MRRPASTPPELPGYTFVRLLGSGGFSDVFLYEQHLPKRRVAVKVLLTDELTAANRAAFVAEANLMAQLSAHPFIVTIYHADVAADDRPYLVMEYCSGPSLAERYKSETFSVEDALRTGVRLSSAVATAHSAGILHRDIKPANVLSNDFGWPALTDFGISSAVEDDALPVHTQTLDRNDTDTSGQSVGMSVPWSPPEMFEDEPNPDVRADVFSLAATIYTILAGHSPFEVRGRSNGTLDLIGRIERGQLTPLQREDVPRSLIAVLRKGMATDREERYAGAVDFARALQRVELELGYAATAIDVPNLAVAAPERESDADGADATVVRSVATIEAQAPAPAEPASAEATLLRSTPSIQAQPAPASVPDAPTETIVRRREPAVEQPEPAEAPAAPRRGRAAAWIFSIAAVLVAGAVVVALVIGGLPGQEQTAEPTTGPTAPPVITAAVPTPELSGDPIAEGATVTFTVSNPEPEDGDRFVWRISNRTASEAVRPITGDTIVVEDWASGSTVCIEVSVLRAGKTSAQPLEACYPQ